MRSTLLPLALAGLTLTVGCGDKDADDSGAPARDYATSVSTDGGTWQVSWTAVPAPVPFNEPFDLDFEVDGADEGFTYELDVTMPDHGHGMQVEPLLTVSETGVLAEGLVFHMTGDWQLTLTVDDGSTRESAELWVDCCE